MNSVPFLEHNQTLKSDYDAPFSVHSKTRIIESNNMRLSLWVHVYGTFFKSYFCGVSGSFNDILVQAPQNKSIIF